MPDAVLAILAHKKSRRFRMTGYLLLALGGSLLIIANDLFVFQVWIWTTMACFLLVGGLLGAYGQWKRVWPPEYMGLPLIWTSMLVFSVYQAATVTEQRGIFLALAVANLSILLAFAILLFSRWLDVSAVYRAAKEDAGARR